MILTLTSSEKTLRDREVFKAVNPTTMIALLTSRDIPFKFFPLTAISFRRSPASCFIVPGRLLPAGFFHLDDDNYIHIYGGPEVRFLNLTSPERSPSSQR